MSNEKYCTVCVAHTVLYNLYRYVPLNVLYRKLKVTYVNSFHWKTFLPPVNLYRYVPLNVLYTVN